ncbi:MAG: TonB-dependent receptor-like protein [Alphaproteobacteria bacterium]|nr:TonB-dependent receptor-like protein [Alphaproteobacteria bacterium]
MKITKGMWRAGCLVTAALGMGLIAASTRAAEVEVRLQFDLPAQDLAESLRAIARISGREVLFPTDAVKGRRAPPVTGRLTLNEAVRAALGESDLEADYRGSAILVRRRSAQSSDSPFVAADDAAIVVTGTRIRGARSASPVTVSTREALQDQGVTDLAGYSRYLLQNFAGGQNPGVAGGGQQGGYNNINNSTTLNLRGLGPDATLTLVNGHRLAYDAVIQGVDISAIPLAAVERVEVITDGASALYGSDAVGGVANIILRHDYDGAQVTARAGGATAGGDQQQQLSAIAGARWSSGGFMAAFDFNRFTPILADQRDFTATISPSQSLITRQSQASLIVSGHQRLGASVELVLDAEATERKSQKSNAFSATAPVTTSGLSNRPKVDSWSVNPGLRIALPAGWEASLTASAASSRTDIFGRRYANSVMTPARVVYVNRLRDAEVGAEGALFEAPGGEARLALGGGWRSLKLDAFNQAFISGALTTNRHTIGRLDALFGYGELSLPVVGAANRLPLVEQLSLSAALRYERYAHVGAVATPKLGLIYAPHRDIRLSATWGRSFKAPTLFQTSQLIQGNLYSSSLFVAPTPPFPAGSTVLVLDGGNPDLRSERATTWSASLELHPLKALELEISGFDVKYEGRVGIPVQSTLGAFANPIYSDLILFRPTLQQVGAVVAGLPQGVVNQSGRPYDPATIAAILDERLANTAHERVRGVDLAARYGADLGGGRLSVETAASYLEGHRQLAEGQPTLQRAGLIFNPPHWRGRAGAGWQGSAFGLSALLSYMGANRDDRFGFARVGSFTTLDLNARVGSRAPGGPLGGWEVRLSALNLLNAKPAAIRNTDPTAVPYDSTNQSPVGRLLSLSVTRSW